MIRARKPMLASLLEKGSPLQVDKSSLTIGFARGSFELSRAQDKEVQDELQGLVNAFFGGSVSMKMVPLSDDASHYVINNGGWTLDGQPIQFPGVDLNDWIARVEWTDQAWNVYRLVK